MFDIDQITKVTMAVLKRLEAYEDVPCAPVGLSNRHIHVSQEDLEILFGSGYALKKLRDVKQPGQFAAEETVTLAGSKNKIPGVRILGPVRGKTQVEISLSDGFILGVKPPVRESGNVEGTPGITVIGPKGTVTIQEGVIAALRHIHMTPEYARKFGFQDKQMVRVEFDGVRKIIFDQVLIRVSKDFVLEMHIDLDEANAGLVVNGQKGKIIL